MKKKKIMYNIKLHYKFPSVSYFLGFIRPISSTWRAQHGLTWVNVKWISIQGFKIWSYIDRIQIQIYTGSGSIIFSWTNSGKKMSEQPYCLCNRIRKMVAFKRQFKKYVVFTWFNFLVDMDLALYFSYNFFHTWASFEGNLSRKYGIGRVTSLWAHLSVGRLVWGLVGHSVSQKVFFFNCCGKPAVYWT